VFENIPLAELAIGRSTVRQRILALLMVEPERRLHLREIQRRVGTSPGTASRELARLLAAGLIEREAEGVQVYFRAADSPVAAMMRQLLLIPTDAPVLPRPSSIARSRRQRGARVGQLAPASVGDPAETPIAPSDGTETDAETGDAPQPIDAPVPALPERPRVINPVPHPSGPGSAGAASEVSAALEGATLPGSGAVGGATRRPLPSPTPLAPSVSTAAAAVPDALGLLVGARFGAAIRPIYGSRLRGLYLFGNRGFGPARDDADVELLIVLDRVDAYGDELERTSAVCAQLTLELGLVVSRVFADQARWPGIVDGFVPVVVDEDER